MLLLLVAMMDVRWGQSEQEVPQRGIEVMFALDVSRSMLAEDVRPNRLSRAKQQIKDLIAEMSGDRIGLVVFAGEAKQVIPLTSHYEDFKQQLDAIGPDAVQRGGSRLGDALQTAFEGFLDKTDGHKTILLLTDGEDQESQPLNVAEQLHREHAVRVFTIGLGDLVQGARIPDTQSRQRSFVEYEGQQVWSKQDGEILSDIATKTGAAYIPAGTKRVDMAAVYHGYIANVEQTEFGMAKINSYVPRFQWFAGAALVLLLWEVWSSTRGSRAFAVAAVGLWLLFQPMGSLSAAETVASRINAANQLLADQKNSEAVQALSNIQQATGLLEEQRQYNLGVALYRNGDPSAAQDLFAQTARSDNASLAAKSRYNLGNCQYAKALAAMQHTPEVAVDQLKQAIDAYRSSLALEPMNSDARANIELASRLLRQLQTARQEQQPQPKPQQEESQEESQQDSAQESQQDSEQESQQDSPQESTQNAEQESTQNSEQESQQDSQSRSDRQEAPSEQSSSPGQDNQADSKSTESQSPESQLDAGNQEEAKSEAASQATNDQPADQKPPSGELTPVNQSQQQDQSQMAAAKPIESGMTQEEAMKLLQSVRDRDMLRRLRLQQRQRSRQIPVDKDW